MVETFLRPLGLGEEINHINGKRDDNRIVNLEIVTRAEHAQKTWDRNRKDAYDAGYAAALEDVKKLQIS
jgi:hypothetical protein